MKYLLAILPMIIWVLACGEGTEGPAGYSTEVGQKVFKKYCIACHGVNGDMQINGAKDLALSVITYQERISIITDGKGAMTPFGGILTEEEITWGSEIQHEIPKSSINMGLSTTVLGAMSGSSLDGLDLILVDFEDSGAIQPGNLAYKVLATATLSYSSAWQQRLARSSNLALDELYKLHLQFGEYVAQLITAFSKNTEEAEIIAFHGHTVYHEPQMGFSLQLGDAQTMAQVLGQAVSSEFRQQDIQLGGQGAPLAPTLEHWLLPDHQLFLNLGGIANLHLHQEENVVGFDIGAANQLLNVLAKEAGKPYDHGGALAKQGGLIPKLLEAAKANTFFAKMPPKSLSNQWVQKEINPLFLKSDGSIPDKLNTACTFIAWQLQQALQQIDHPEGSIFVTGGGAHNHFLVQKLQESVTNKIEVPEAFWIEQKESLLMALLGFLKLKEIPNVLSSVTGSKKDHSAGNIYRPL